MNCRYLICPGVIILILLAFVAYSCCALSSRISALERRERH